MKCWRCGMDNADGAALCVYCGAAQQRPAPVSEIGKALRSLYNRYGCREVLTQSPYLVSGLGDLAADAKKERNLLKSAMDAGIGSCCLEQLERSGKPDDAFYARVRTLLTEEAGLGEKAAADVAGWFDEMIGWAPDRGSAPPPKPRKNAAAPQAEQSGKAAPPPKEISREPQAEGGELSAKEKRGLLPFEIAGLAYIGLFIFFFFLDGGAFPFLLGIVPLVLSFLPKRKKGKAPIPAWIPACCCGLALLYLILCLIARPLKVSLDDCMWFLRNLDRLSYWLSSGYSFSLRDVHVSFDYILAVIGHIVMLIQHVRRLRSKP